MTKPDPISREEFLETYARNSKMSVEKLLALMEVKHQNVVECHDCEYGGCRGWKMETNLDDPAQSSDPTS